MIPSDLTDHPIETWEDAERHWPESSAAWDRDLAHEGWVPILRSRIAWPGAGSGWGEPRFALWADDETCVERTRRYGQNACRCAYWDGERWIRRIKEHDEWQRGYDEGFNVPLSRWPMPDYSAIPYLIGWKAGVKDRERQLERESCNSDPRSPGS